MIERREEPQALVALKQRLLDLHLPAGQRAAGVEALRAGQELCPGLHLVSDHLETLPPRIRSCTHAVGLRGRDAGVSSHVC